MVELPLRLVCWRKRMWLLIEGVVFWTHSISQRVGTESTASGVRITASSSGFKLDRNGRASCDTVTASTCSRLDEGHDGAEKSSADNSEGSNRRKLQNAVIVHASCKCLVP